MLLPVPQYAANNQLPGGTSTLWEGDSVSYACRKFAGTPQPVGSRGTRKMLRGLKLAGISVHVLSLNIK